MEYWKLVWMFVVAFLFGRYQSEGCWEIEKAALLQLKPFFPHINDEGISWGKGNCCRWNGVECSTSTGRVTRLFLEYSSVEVYNKDIYQGWYLNISLFLPFEELKSLNLGGNNIVGFIHNQELDNLKNLKELYLNDNKIESLHSKRQLRLTKLEVLDLSYNNFNNSKFSSLAVLPHLKSLNIESNNLTEWRYIQDLNVLSNLKILNISYEGNNNSVPSQDNRRELKSTSLEELNLWGYVLDILILSSTGFCELRQLQTLTIINNDWNASLRDCFSELISLKYLNLSSNKFFGNISIFKDLMLLEYLDLSYNNFFGDVSLFKSLTSLRELRLYNNNIEIPSSLAPLFNLSKLQDIFADNNMIHNAETEMHSLDTPTFQLRSISLSCCGDGESFPQSLNHQHDLQYVDLSNINFKGDQFPNWLLENNKKLENLSLANSSLSGHFQLPSTSRRGLLYLDVSNNSLDGNIPNEIGAKLPSLEQLNMSNNKLSGGIPRHMPMGLLIFDVSNNQLFGDIQSSMENMSHLVTLDLSNNILSGGIPRWVGKMSDLEELVMANNHFEGSIPMEFCKLNHSLQFLDLSANNRSGSLPSCFSSSILSHVYLSRNKLKGPITRFFNSSGLVTLDLSNNHLTGSIPNWIGSLSWLVYLLLNNNHFEVGIPVQLCKLYRLRLINISNNNLSGTIPPCLTITILYDSSHADVPIEFTMKSISYFYKGRVLTFLSGIDLSCNKLTGEIRLQFHYFQDIIVLNFSHNSLIGPIPPALSDLSQIESLDLSHNHLSGNIPSQIVGLHFCPFSVWHTIIYLELHLKGPDNLQHLKKAVTWGILSFVVNHCQRIAQLMDHLHRFPKNATNEGFIDMKIFYASVVGSYIVMPLCIAIVLYINPYWRQAWFYHVEAATMSCYYFVVDHFLPKRFR